MRKNQPSPGRSFTLKAKKIGVATSLYSGGEYIRITAHGWHKQTPKAERVAVELQVTLEQLITLRDEISHALDTQSKYLMEMLSRGDKAVMAEYSNARESISA